MSGQPTVVYHAANPQQAHLLKGLLEDRGIAAWVDNENIQIAGGELPLGWTAAARVVVGENDEEEALRIVRDFDAKTAHEPTPDAPEAGETADRWLDWPVCPQCQERRQARCGICGSAGTDFPLADIEQGNGESRVLLICASCDDHFRPEFYRLCHRCGHDFGDGIEVNLAPTPSDQSRRAWLLLLGLVGGVLALMAYFAWLMR